MSIKTVLIDSQYHPNPELQKYVGYEFLGERRVHKKCRLCKQDVKTDYFVWKPGDRDNGFPYISQMELVFKGKDKISLIKNIEKTLKMLFKKGYNHTAFCAKDTNDLFASNKEISSIIKRIKACWGITLAYYSGEINKGKVKNSIMYIRGYFLRNKLK